MIPDAARSNSPCLRLNVEVVGLVQLLSQYRSSSENSGNRVSVAILRARLVLPAPGDPTTMIRRACLRERALSFGLKDRDIVLLGKCPRFFPPVDQRLAFDIQARVEQYRTPGGLMERFDELI